MLEKIKYNFMRGFFRTLGRTSQGIDLCFEYGATSGQVLDYIYQNEPRGSWGIGKLIDSFFLNYPSCQGVRYRKEFLEKLIVEAVEDLKTAEKNVHLMDMASGPASYILSVLAKVGEENISTCCRDIDERWLREGAKEAKRLKLKSVNFEKGDAFDSNSLLSHKPKPNLMVLSGFYDWISDDSKVIESLDLVHQVLDNDGYFILANQMSHPNVKFVNGVFSHFDHEPLKLTLRSKEKIHHWLEEQGFVVEKTLCDPSGFYSVTKARKA